MLGLFVSSLFGLLVPWMIREAIDGIAAGGRGRLGAAILRLLLFAALHASFRYLARRGLLVTARRVERHLRRDVFAHVVRLPWSFFGGMPTGDVMSRLTNDISAVWLFLGPGLLTLAGTLISYVLAVGFMVRISPALTAVALAAAPIVVILSREYGRAFHRLHRSVQESLASMNGRLQENIAGIRLVKAYGLETREEERFDRACRDYYRHNVAVSRTQAAFHGGIGFAAGAGVALVLFVGGWLVIRRDLTLGGLVAFNAYLGMLAFPTMALGWVINLLQRGGSAMGRINELLRTPVEPEVASADGSMGVPSTVPPVGATGGRPHAGGRGPLAPTESETTDIPSVGAAPHPPQTTGRAPLAPAGGHAGAGSERESMADGHGAAAANGGPSRPMGESSIDAGAAAAGKDGDPFLAIRGLSFSYGRERPGAVLDGLSLAVGRGELVGLVGPTGSGKSTLLSLLLRLVDVPPGTIFLDGRDVNAIPLSELRRRIALVGQDPFLFSDTILRNIGFGLAAPDEASVREAAARARILAEIEEMPAAFRTVIGERGTSLSGGQRQRVTIARALCREADLLLLDDALSSVDSETEEEVFREILGMRGGRTIVFSTHRMASLARCDRVLVLAGGRIAEEGTHGELLARRGLYHELYSRQMLSRELEEAP